MADVRFIMENGIFVVLTEYLLKIPGMFLVMELVGLPGIFVVFLLMPLRLIWVISTWMKPGDEVIINKVSYRISNIFLVLAVYSAIEPIVAMVNASPGGTSGLLLLLFSFIPFIFYLFFEWYRRKAYKYIENNESN